MSTIWQVPVASLEDRELGMSRRLLRETSRWVVAPPRDSRPSRARHERLPVEVRMRGAGTTPPVE